MKWAHSLRLRVTLWCALLLTLCCTALAVTSNLSAIQLADSITAVPSIPLRRPPDLTRKCRLRSFLPGSCGPAGPAAFHIQSLLATAAILAAGLLLIYLLVGRALAPLKNSVFRSKTGPPRILRSPPHSQRRG